MLDRIIIARQIRLDFSQISLETHVDVIPLIFTLLS